MRITEMYAAMLTDGGGKILTSVIVGLAVTLVTAYAVYRVVQRIRQESHIYKCGSRYEGTCTAFRYGNRSRSNELDVEWQDDSHTLRKRSFHAVRGKLRCPYPVSVYVLDQDPAQSNLGRLTMTRLYGWLAFFIGNWALWMIMCVTAVLETFD